MGLSWSSLSSRPAALWRWVRRVLGFRSIEIYNPSAYQEKQITSVPPEQVESLFFTFPQRIDNTRELKLKYQCNCLSTYTVLQDEELKAEIQETLFKHSDKSFSSPESRSLACFLGMVIGDALGTPLEFSRLSYENNCLQDFSQTELWDYPNNKFQLKPGQWTDDASMGFCLGESLLMHPEFNPIDLRIRFLNWWEFGYRNSFGKHELKHSVGLGACIGSSFVEFAQEKSEYTVAGNRFTSGNGSIMRLAAVPIRYHSDIELAMEIAYKQSKTTHQGDEAAECCRLMTFIIVSFINCDNSLSFEERKMKVFNDLADNFHTDLYSVRCLAQSKDEELHESNENLNLEDRKWNWRSSEFRYCESRARQQPGYIGSYCMDGLAMSLHCVWNTNSFQEALLKVINLRGDADTVGSITGQIAGSLYGVETIPTNWIQAIQQWDNNGEASLLAVTLFRKDMPNQ